ncbi:MAG: hypothetical protein O2955_01555 [Planctomycetota bacterium]|nr:hypothetical protein [Planctomycetota bacterium]MDA1211169.1 hypothetical protein [Planctomycetota bacterium]
MINNHTLLEFVNVEPFQPFRIHMASGRQFEIRHPEMIKVGRSSITVHTYPDEVENPVDRWQEVSLMLLESVEPMEATARHS